MPTNINEGSNGFHMYTVVTDGYGNLISEDHRGYKLAEVSCRDFEDNDPTPYAELARLTLAVLNGDAEPIDPQAKEM